MNSQDLERIKPFKLVKFFTFSSLVFILVGALVLSIVIARRAEKVLIKKSEDYALLMAENLNHQVFLQFIVPAAIQFGQVIQLRNERLFERLDKVVRSTLHSFSVEMVNIYDRKDNVIFYSFDESLLGEKGRGGIDYRGALQGTSTSRLVRREGYGSLIFGVPKESELRTYVPLRAEKPLSSLEGPILGVFEIVQDLSKDYKTIARFKQRIMLTSVGVMGTLFLILLYIVRRGERIIQKRAGERLMLREKLNQAERLASLGEMVAAVSHEIRNPLGIISSTAELLKGKLKRTDPEDRLADVIVEEANRLNEIVTDFLNFARPPTPKLMSCRVEEILAKNLRFLAPEIKSGGYRVHQYIAPGISEVQADPGLLYQAFLNILINAMQAMPQGGSISVEISVRDNFLLAVFSDEGPGKSNEMLGKIWDPFFTTKDKGSGLGLPIVKKIIEGLGGTVELQNRDTGGARVTISFPIDGEKGVTDGNRAHRG